MRAGSTDDFLRFIRKLALKAPSSSGGMRRSNGQNHRVRIESHIHPTLPTNYIHHPEDDQDDDINAVNIGRGQAHRFLPVTLRRETVRVCRDGMEPPGQAP